MPVFASLRTADLVADTASAAAAAAAVGKSPSLLGRTGKVFSSLFKLNTDPAPPPADAPAAPTPREPRVGDIVDTIFGPAAITAVRGGPVVDTWTTAKAAKAATVGTGSGSGLGSGLDGGSRGRSLGGSGGVSRSVSNLVSSRGVGNRHSRGTAGAMSPGAMSAGAVSARTAFSMAACPPTTSGLMGAASAPASPASVARVSSGMGVTSRSLSSSPTPIASPAAAPATSKALLTPPRHNPREQSPPASGQQQQNPPAKSPASFGGAKVSPNCLPPLSPVPYSISSSSCLGGAAASVVSRRPRAASVSVTTSSDSDKGAEVSGVIGEGGGVGESDGLGVQLSGGKAGVLLPEEFASSPPPPPPPPPSAATAAAVGSAAALAAGADSDAATITPAFTPLTSAVASAAVGGGGPVSSVLSKDGHDEVSSPLGVRFLRDRRSGGVSKADAGGGGRVSPTKTVMYEVSGWVIGLSNLVSFFAFVCVFVVKKKKPSVYCTK